MTCTPSRPGCIVYRMADVLYLVLLSVIVVHFVALSLFQAKSRLVVVPTKAKTRVAWVQVHEYLYTAAVRGHPRNVHWGVGAAVLTVTRYCCSCCCCGGGSGSGETTGSSTRTHALPRGWSHGPAAPVATRLSTRPFGLSLIYVASKSRSIDRRAVVLLLAAAAADGCCWLPRCSAASVVESP